MTTEELTEKYKKFAEPGGPLHGMFTVQKVASSNFKPHPFMMGSAHVIHASKHCGGVLGDETTDKIGCAWRGLDGEHGPKCGLPPKDHTHDTVLLVALVRDLTNKEAHAALLALKPAMLDDNVAGVGFINFAKPFSIAPPEKGADK